MQVPDAIEPAVGYRVWEVKGDRLYSLRHEQLWEPNEPFEAFCQNEGHEPPEPGCSCGVYAALTFARLFEMGYTKTSGLFGSPYGEVTIAGQINIWGGVIPGRIGWRGQFAYPRRLYVPYTRWRLARPLAEAYGVPFKLYNLERTH